MVGRKNEVLRLMEALENPESEFIAVYGRRRVGKTYLIRQTYQNRFAFYHTGVARGGMEAELEAFRDSLVEFGDEDRSVPESWMGAFKRLNDLLERSSEGKKIVFIDEMPWMDTPRSRFLSALEHFWNKWASARTDIVLVICGSATSWIVKKVIHNRGGLHNRLTGRIHVKEFTLGECEQYAEERNLGMSRGQLAEAYMIFGGVPYYWSFLRKSESLAQNVDRLIFSEDGELSDEFDELYASLFKRKDTYVKLVLLLADHQEGLSRDEIVRLAHVANNGRLSSRLEELEQCGFVQKYHVIGRPTGEVVYRLVDAYTVFYRDFVQENVRKDESFWSDNLGGGRYYDWRGHAFERLVLRHVRQVKAALGVSGVSAEVGCWRHAADASCPHTVQIDLVLDRDDRVVNLCELKYTDEPYVVTDSEMAKVRRRRTAYRTVLGTDKSLHLTAITSWGLERNMYAKEFQREIVLEDLFS